MSAIAAAAARVERNPTDAQKEAGNYRKGHFRWEGLDIAIENPAGGFRRGKDADGKEWEVKLPVHYGYVKGTMGADGDAVDVFINPKPEPGPVYVIDQVDPHTGAFDEHKCLMGFREQIDAVLAYADSYSDGKGRQRIGAISALPLPAFKAWLETRRTKKPLAYDPDRVPLKKRKKGSPLSEAEHAQRVAAAKARWEFRSWRLASEGKKLASIASGDYIARKVRIVARPTKVTPGLVRASGGRVKDFSGLRAVLRMLPKGSGFGQVEPHGPFSQNRIREGYIGGIGRSGQKSVYPSSRGFSIVASDKGSLIHEMGHAVDGRRAPKAMSAMAGLAHTRDVNRLRRILGYGRDGGPAMPYSSTNIREGFAEAVRALQRAPAMGGAIGAVRLRSQLPNMMRFAAKAIRKASEVEDLAKASPGIAQRLLNTAERIEEDLATRIGRTLAWLSGSPADAVIEAVEQGLPTDAAAEALPTDSITIRMRRELRPLDDAFSGGGKIGDEALPATAGGRRIDVDFDRKNRLVNERLATYKLDLIRQITDDQKETIKRILVDALEEGAPPAVIARSIREQIGLTDSQAQHVANYRAELENLDAGALQRSLRDARYDPTIARAISEQRDLSPDQIDRMVDAYRRRYIAYRAMTIARTEALRAVNTGQRASIEAAGQVGQLDDMVLEKRWIATRDNRTRDSHVDLNGKVVIGLDTPFITQSGAAIRWPHDDQAPADETIRCRCTLAFRLVPRG
jgi:hypothetical protein